MIISLYKFIILTLIFISTYSHKIHHTCTHDQKFKDTDILIGTSKSKKRHLQEQQQPWEPLRLTIDYTPIQQTLKEEQQNFIKKLGLISQKFFFENLQVKRIQGNNTFDHPSTVCSDHFIPQKDKTLGIQNSDIHIYITSENNPYEDFVAGATSCLLSDLNKNDVLEGYIETILHEITHTLGFSNNLYKFWINPQTQQPFYMNNESPIKTETINDKSLTFLTTEKVKQFAQQYYNCTSLQGMILEDGGGSGTAGSHWDRNALENEFMTGFVVTHDAIYSNFTFKLLEDTGWYLPTYKYIDESNWGKNKGCDFILNCKPSQFREFNYGEDDDYLCNFYHNSIVKQEKGTDQTCTLQKPQRICIDNTFKPPIDTSLSGETYGQNSRCFESNLRHQSNTLFDQVDYDLLLNNLRCLNFQCDKKGDISVNIDGETYPIDRETNEATITPIGQNQNLEGVVIGPEDWHTFCFGYPEPCKNFCSKNGYCLQRTCHCIDNYGGEDCSIFCPNVDQDNKINCILDGECLQLDHCPEGYILKEETRECLKIDTSCQNQNFIQNQGEFCVDECPIRTYTSEFAQDQQKCKACSDHCIECDDLSNCIQCEEDFARYQGKCLFECPSDDFVKDCGLPCPKGQYSDGESCRECSENCDICSSKDFCEKCNEGRLRAIDFNNDTAGCQTQDFCYANGFDVRSSEGICVKCPENQKVFLQGQCYERCPVGQYLKYGECRECHKSCRSCSEQNSCDECKEGYKRDRFVGGNTQFCIKKEEE